MNSRWRIIPRIVFLRNRSLG